MEKNLILILLPFMASCGNNETSNSTEEGEFKIHDYPSEAAIKYREIDSLYWEWSIVGYSRAAMIANNDTVLIVDSLNTIKSLILLNNEAQKTLEELRHRVDSLQSVMRITKQV